LESTQRLQEKNGCLNIDHINTYTSVLFTGAPHNDTPLGLIRYPVVLVIRPETLDNKFGVSFTGPNRRDPCVNFKEVEDRFEKNPYKFNVRVL